MSARHRTRKIYFQHWRFIHIVCALFVFAYIAFDVLDLDLSDFPLKPAQQKAAAVVEVPKLHEFVESLNWDVVRLPTAALQASSLKEFARFQQTTIRRGPPHRDRFIVYHRVNRPPHSSSDSSPAA